MISVRRHAAGAAGAVSVTRTETRGGDSKTLKDTSKAKAKESVGYFDEVVMAAHSDQTLRVLGDAATAAERAALAAVRYQSNDVYLHTDASLMPRNREAWASWELPERRRKGEPHLKTRASASRTG